MQRARARASVSRSVNVLLATVRFMRVLHRARAQPLRPAVLAPAHDTVLYCALACFAHVDHLRLSKGLHARSRATLGFMCVLSDASSHAVAYFSSDPM